MVVLALFGVRRSSFLGWIAFIILLSHSVVSHKEERFIYPLAPLILTLAALGIVEIANDLNDSFEKPIFSQRVIVGIGLISCALLSYSFASQFVYWQKDSGAMVAFDRLSRDSNLCGVGLYNIGWFDTGGYTHLHKNVPIILISKASELQKDAASFNAVITDGVFESFSNSFVLEGCHNRVCLYRRPSGSCRTPSGNDINTILKRMGN